MPLLPTRSNPRRRLRTRARKGIAIAILSLMFAAGGVLAWAAVLSIPPIDNFQSRKTVESTKIYDRTGSVLLYDVHGAMRRTEVPIEEMSPSVRNATVAIEDATFYEHGGFRPLSFMRALAVDILTGSFAQGGSTITQQVVKNSLLTSDKTIVRKLKEIVLAIKLERVYTKDQILATYLNETSYGGTIYGVQEASQYFFGVDAKDLSIAQSAYLAALPQAPTRYSPYGNHRDQLERRKNLVLTRMKENGFVTQEEYARAKEDVVEFRNEAEAGIKAPHFVFFIREYIEEKYGADAVENGGLQVVTTLDWDLQKKAETVMSKAALENEKKFDASNTGLVAIEPQSGQILAMVGSRGYFDENIDGKVNIALAKRQPGSAFKPFVYAAAFGKGYTPDTIVFDLKTQFSTACSPFDTLNDTPPCYSPDDYDGKVRGPMTLRDALAQSINIAAIKVLYMTGLDDALETAQRLGITTLADKDRYGLTLVLGGGEVSLLEMTGAYSAFANDGVRSVPTGVLRVTDSRGMELERYEQKSERVLDPQIARQISDILSDNGARAPIFGANSALNFPGRAVAAKTGTTNDYKDAWVIGYTRGVAIGAWAGNNDNTPMQKKVAAMIVTPPWHEVMAYALQKYPAEPFAAPAPDPGYDALSPVLRGSWDTNSAEGVHDILYWVDKDDPRGSRPANPASDPQFAHWDYPVQLWAQANSRQPVVAGESSAPPQKGAFLIMSPQSGTTVSSAAPLIISSYHSNPALVSRVSYFLNDAPIGSSTSAPYVLSVQATSRGPAAIRAVAETAVGQEEARVSFTIQ